jgi:hypothetical protein
MAQFRKERDGWELHLLFSKRRGTDKTKSPERWLDFPGREKEDVMEDTANDIKRITREINGNFDSVREQLKALQELLDQLGNPGCTFIDDNEEQVHIHSDGYHYYLAYKRGKMRMIRIHQAQRVQNETLELHQIPLHIVADTLNRLPIFLSYYKRFLERIETKSDLTQDRLTKLVEAITAILNEK